MEPKRLDRRTGMKSVSLQRAIFQECNNSYVPLTKQLLSSKQNSAEKQCGFSHLKERALNFGLHLENKTKYN